MSDAIKRLPEVAEQGDLDLGDAWDQNQVQFCHLPLEIKDMILQQLDQDVKKDARLVCREWEKVLDNHLHYRLLLDDKSVAAYKLFDSQKSVYKVHVEDFHFGLQSKSKTRSLMRKNVKTFFFGNGCGFPGEIRRHPDRPYEIERDRAWGYRALCRSFIPATKISQSSMRTLLDINTDIEGLTVSQVNFCSLVNEFPSMKGLRLELLTKLDIHYADMEMVKTNSRKATNTYVIILQNSYPSLKVLHYSSTSWKAEFRLLLAVYQCIAGHRSTLNEVRIFHTTVYSLTHAMESGDWFPVKKFQELESNLCKCKLKYLMMDLMKCGPNFGHRWRDLEKSFLLSQSELTDLRFISVARELVDFNYHSMFNLVQHTVTKIDLYWHCLNQPPFDCESLKNCVNLIELKLNVLRMVQVVPGTHAKAFINMHYLPKGLKSLTCGQMLANGDAIWISENLLNLENMAYTCVKNDEEISRTFEHFIQYLTLPKLLVFEISNYFCPRIARFVHITDGLSIEHSVVFTKVEMDRNCILFVEI